MKAYLGIMDTTYDDFLNAQLVIISESVEGYCGRKFELAAWEQTFYVKDYERGLVVLPLFHFPVKTLDSILEDTTDIVADIRIHKPTGFITDDKGFFRFAETLVVEYTAGYDTVPSPIKSVVYSLVEERYNKKKNNIDLNFGSDVQRISIPGTISIDFDYSLQANERKIAFGTILGNFVNVLDSYRSERVVTGSGKLAYVEPNP